MKKIMLVTTVPETFRDILSGQPKHISGDFIVELVSSPSKSLEAVSSSEGCQYHGVKMHRGISLISDLVSLFRMVKLLQKTKPDILHTYTPKAGLIGMLAGYICGVPTRIHTFTGLIFPTSQGLLKKILIAMDKVICLCSTNVIPEGAGVKNDLLEYNITSKPLNVIGNGNIAGVETSYFDVSSMDNLALLDYKKELNIYDGKVFCFVGRLTKEKGVEELVSAFERLSERAHLIFVGEIDKRTPLSEKTLDSIEKNSRIHRLGYLSDIRLPLAISDVFVLPSYREGFPNALLQAGSMRLPAIVSDINGCNEVILDDVNGWVVTARSSDELFTKMNESLHSNCFEMGHQARKLVKTKFERSEYLKELMKFYFSVVNSHDD